MKQFLVGMMSFLLFTACNNPKPEETAETSTDTTSKAQPAEFADAKYMAIGKSGIASMASGDIDGWASNWADNIVWQWNNGDSVAGKAAVVQYWKDRRANTIDSIAFSDDIWLPVKVNQPQANEEAGIWLLGWYNVNAKYKTGKSMTQWMHMAQHFNANDKIDRIIHYMDKASVMEATKK